MSDDRRLYEALLREDLRVFVERAFATLEPGTAYEDNWHIGHLCWQLQRVARGEVRRLIINVPPRSMKSIVVSVAFTSWLMGRDPTRRIICTSYADDLARKLSVDTLSVMREPWYGSLFPSLVLSSRKMTELRTTQHGYRYAAGMGGSILGRGADLIIVDDPIKPVDARSKAERRRVNEAFDNTLYTRLNDKRTGAIVIIMQRLHQDDLVGHVLARDDWEHVVIPAIAPERMTYRIGDASGQVYHRTAGEILSAREPLEQLETLRRVQGSLTFSAQYQQAPVPPDGNVLRREWIKHFRQRPESFDYTIASWDTASTLSETSDYSVGTIWGAKGLDFYLLDLIRGRFEVPDLRRRIIDLAARWSVDQIVIEDTELGRTICQDLRRAGEYQAVLQRSRHDKEARFLAQTSRFESGQVHVPEDVPWLADWMEEVLAFPNSSHDDQVDSTSQALHHLTGRMQPLAVEAVPRKRPTGTRPTRTRPAGFTRS